MLLITEWNVGTVLRDMKSNNQQEALDIIDGKILILIEGVSHIETPNEILLRITEQTPVTLKHFYTAFRQCEPMGRFVIVISNIKKKKLWFMDTQLLEKQWNRN